MKLVKENINEYINENAIINDVYRVRMIGDIEFTKKELDEFMSINGLDMSDLKKGATNLAKVKWKNMVKSAIESHDMSNIDDKFFKWNIK